MNLKHSCLLLALFGSRIEATGFNKQLRTAAESKAAWSKVLQRGLSTGSDQLSDVRDINYDTLRLSRVRLDAFNMLLSRLFIHDQNYDSMDLCLYTDGSPQYRGVELLASTLDFRIVTADGVYRVRILLPAVSICMGMFGLEGKAVTLCWQLWLTCGPTYTQMRQALSRVRALTLDFGTEAGLPDVRDILLDFCRFIGVPVLANVVTQRFLLPRGLMEPGMRHSIDRLIKRSLMSLDFFPVFLDRLRAIVAFVRDRKKDLAHQLTSNGYPDVADLVLSATLVPFAKWRWGTLRKTAREVATFIVSFSETISLEDFKKRAQDPTLLRRMIGALNDKEWFGSFMPTQK